VFLVRSVYFNLRNILPNLAHSSRDTLFLYISYKLPVKLPAVPCFS